MKSILPSLLKQANLSSRQTPLLHFHAKNPHFINCFQVLYHNQLSILQQQQRCFHSQLALLDAKKEELRKAPLNDEIKTPDNKSTENSTRNKNDSTTDHHSDGSLLQQKYELVQEKVEDALPERMQHLKQQEGETDAQHRKRLAMTFTDKVKEFIKKYGILGVVVYFGIYFANITLFFFLIEYGVFKQGDIVQKLKDWGLGKHFDVEKTLSGKKSSFALAWILTKFTEPLRMMITVSIVPSIYRGMVSARLIREIVTKAKTP